MTISLPLLAVISGISSFSLAIVVPALPSLAERYGTDAAGAQLLIAGYLLGLAVSQPLWGPITDRIGRRVTVMAGFSLYVLSTLACLSAETLAGIAILRALQAAGGSAGTVVARAVIRDVFPPDDGARAMSWVTIGLGAAPVIAPMIGGAIMITGHFEALFLVMAILGTGLWLLLYFFLPETLPADTERPALRTLLKGYGVLLQHRTFLGYTAVYGLIQGGFFAFLAVGASVFADSFDIGAAQFGTIWGCMGVAYVLGAVVTGRVPANQRRRLLPVSILCTVLLGVILLALQLSLGATVAGIVVPLFLMMSFAGGITPLVMAGAVYQVPHLAGTAAGLSSAIGMTLGGAFTTLSGTLYQGSFTPIAILICIAGTMTFAAWFTIRDS